MTTRREISRSDAHLLIQQVMADHDINSSFKVRAVHPDDTIIAARREVGDVALVITVCINLSVKIDGELRFEAPRSVDAMVNMSTAAISEPQQAIELAAKLNQAADFMASLTSHFRDINVLMVRP